MSLDWLKIPTWQEFQHLINEVGWAEFGKAGYIPSDPLIGADGGLDGVYRGKYGGFEGLWGIQATIDKDFNTKLNKSLDSAKAAGVNFLLYATNAKSLSAVDKESFNNTSNNGRVDRIIFWDKDSLEKLISSHPWIEYKYFKTPQIPMFVPIQEYRDFQKEVLLEETHGRDEELDEIINGFVGAEDENNKVAVIYAPGGYGKTHFILNVVKNVYESEADYEVLFCKPEIRKVSDAFNDELKAGQKYLLVLDDAERYVEFSKELIANVLSSSNIKLILSTRTSGTEVIKKLLNRYKVYTYFELGLKRLDQQILLEIFNKVLKIPIEHPERIVEPLEGNLYLIVKIAQLRNGNADVNPVNIRRKIADDLLENATSCLSAFGLQEVQIKQVCTQLSLVVPFSLEKGTSIAKLKELMPFFQSEDHIMKAVRSLADRGVLHSIGSRVRFNPDMVGDIFLCEMISELHGDELINEAFTNWLSAHPSEVTANIAAASRHLEDKNAVETAISQFIQPFINNYHQDDGMQRCENLKLITNIAHLAPSKALQLIEVYENNSTDDSYSPDRDDYGPILFHVLHLKDCTEGVLRLVCLIDQKGTKGTYNNYLPNTLIKNLASPIEVGMEIAIKTLTVLFNWISKKDCPLFVVKLAVEAAKESLAGAHNHHESYGLTLTFGKRMLRLHRRVLEYRDLGIKILQTILNNENDDFVRVGFSIIPHIGEDGDPNGELWERILEDKRMAIKMLEDLLTGRKDLPWSIKVIIEDLLIKIWANNEVYPTLEQEVERVMKFVGKDTEYKVYAYYAAPDFHINDFEEVKKNAPAQGRWAWLVREFFRYDEVKEEEIRPKIEELAKKYEGLDNTINFLNLLDCELNYQQRWGYAPIIEVWSKVNPLLPKAIAENPEILNQIPKRFHAGLHIACANENINYINEFYQRFIEVKKDIDFEIVNTLLTLIGNFPIDPRTAGEWIKYIVGRTEQLNILNNILHRLFFFFNKPENAGKRDSLVEILMLYLDKGLKQESFDMYDFLLHHAREWSVPGLEILKNKLFQILKDAGRIDHHGDELLNFTIATLDDFIEFVEYRLNKQSEPSQSWKTFDAIPSQGFSIGNKLIENYEGFKKFTDKMIEWHSQDKIYSFDIENLIEGMNRQNAEEFTKQYIVEQINGGRQVDMEKAVACLQTLHFSKGNLDMFSKVLDACVNTEFKDESLSALSHQVFSGGFSSTVGEAPPALVHKKDALFELQGLVQNHFIKDFIGRLIKDLEGQIQRHITEGEEMKKPKR